MISNSVFRTPLPVLYPKTPDYINFWKEEAKRSVEGYWVSGKWCPEKLYFYHNYGVIRKNVGNAKVKSFSNPDLRDIEWKIFLTLTEARGFSGFTLDPVYSCDELLIDPIVDDEYLKTHAPYLINEHNQRKLYRKPQEYLNSIHPANYGSPMYNNSAKNFVLVGARDFGKSFSVGGAIAHEFLFDGKLIYNPNSSEITAAETLIGAGDAKYSSETLAKVRDMLDRIPGTVSVGDVTYPSPFARRYKGTWAPGDEVTFRYRKKIGGQWTIVGTGSSIKHRTFRDNPYAANGLRLSLMVFEEIGIFDNLKEAYSASVNCQTEGGNKFGTMIFTGTGSLMEQGILPAKELFYNPEAFNCVAFEDQFEHKGKIGLFIPATLALKNFKTDGVTDEPTARAFIELKRAKMRTTKGSDSSLLERELINNPIVPSEMFLSVEGVYFPVVELRERLSKLENELDVRAIQKKLKLYFSPNSVYNGVDYQLDLKNECTPIDKFPWDGNSKEGCVVCYELPQLIENKVPYGAYIIAYDPYATDGDGESLAAIYVWKTSKYFNKIGFNEIVAVYVGRPYAGRHIVNETLYKLSRFYGNAKIYFEAVRGNTKEYFEKIKRLDLLAHAPQTVFTTKATGDVNRVDYGYPMSGRKMKLEGINYLRDLLLEERETKDEQVIRNLDRIWDIATIQELLNFNLEGNFDRVSALIILGAAVAESTNKYENLIDKKVTSSLDFITNNKNIFANDKQFSTAKAVLF